MQILYLKAAFQLIMQPPKDLLDLVPIALFNFLSYPMK